MIQYHKQLSEQVNVFNNSIADYAHIQKIYSTSRYVCLSCRTKGKTHYLYFGRGARYEGVWTGDKQPESFLRKIDKFLEYLRRYLTGGRLLKLYIDPIDRIVTILYIKNGKDNYFQLFWKGRSLCFLNNYFDLKRKKWRLFSSWNGDLETIKRKSGKTAGDIAELLEVFDSIGRKESKELDGKESEVQIISALLKEEKEKALLNSGPTKREKKRAQRKYLNIGKDLEKTKKWRVLQELVSQDNLDLESRNKIDVGGVIFKFRNGSNYYQRRDVVYKKIKGLKIGEEIQAKRYQQASVDLKKITSDNLPADLGENKLNVIAPVWFRKQKKPSELNNQKNNTDIVEMKLKNEIKMAFGKNIHGNDYLRNVWSKKEDYWFHIDGERSCHGVVKISSMGDLSMDDLVVIGSIIRDISGKDILLIPLIYTQVKNLKGIKGQAGGVLYKKEKYLTVSYENNWKEMVIN